MKLITYSKDNVARCGVLRKESPGLTDKGIIDITSAWDGKDRPQSVLEILQRGPACIGKIAGLTKSAADLIPLDSAKLLAPIPRPGKIIALAGNYSEHIKEASTSRGFKLGLSDSPRETTTPRPFIMPSTAVANPGDKIPWPVYSETIDYELELGIVIGKKAKCIEAGVAMDSIAGYTIVNDVSARSVTFTANRKKRPWDEFYDWLNGKWADGFCPMGPYLLTADEIEDVQNLNMQLTVNDEIRQKANTSQMIYSVADIVSFVSHIMTLEPGDVIATGTPSGVAMATGNFLKAGDKIDASIEKLGNLTNTLGPKPEKFYKPLK